MSQFYKKTLKYHLFHLIKYKLTWDEVAIRIYIEGEKAYEIALNETLPFDQPFSYL